MKAPVAQLSTSQKQNVYDIAAGAAVQDVDKVLRAGTRSQLMADDRGTPRAMAVFSTHTAEGFHQTAIFGLGHHMADYLSTYGLTTWFDIGQTTAASWQLVMLE